MITAAEQYRALVAKLESINPSTIVEAPLELPPGADPEAGMTVAAPQAAAPAPSPAPAAAPAVNVEQQIMNAPTFSQAYAMARKAGLKTFKYCRTYAVKDAPVRPPVQPKPSAPAPGKVDYTNQASPLGGDAQNPMSFAANSNFGA